MSEILKEQKHIQFNSPEYCKLLFENNPLPMWIYDTETLQFLAVNNQAVKIYGYSREEFKQMTLKDIRPAEDIKKLKENIKTNDQNWQKSRGWKHRIKNGTLIDVEIYSHYILSEGRKARLVVACEITEQIKTFNDLRNSEARYRDFFDSVGVGMAEIGIDRTILSVNRKLIEIVGYSEDELIGKKFTDITYPADLEIGPHYFKKLVNNEADHFNYEKRYIKKNGQVIWVKLTTAKLKQFGEEKERFLSVIEDISDNKKSEMQKNLLADIVESSDDAIIGLDMGLKITSWNRGAERIFGYTEKEVLGKESTFFHPTVCEDDDVINIAKLKEEKRIEHYETVRQHKDGRLVDVSISISSIKNYNGELVGFSKIARDITRQKKSAEEIRNLLELEKKARYESEKNHKRLKILTRAGEVLNSSLNYEQTLSQLAKVTVPGLADWCAVEVLDKNGRLQRVAVEHIDRSKVKFAFEIAKKYPSEADENRGVYKVLKTGLTEIYKNIPDEYLKEITKSEQHYKLIKMLGIKSAVIAPLISRDKVLGVISFIGEKQLTENSMLTAELAESLARRAAVAIDNANLYEEAKNLNQELEERVQKRTEQLEIVNKELEAFSYSVSHDLRAPLRAIDGFSGFLFEDYSEKLDDEGRRLLKVIRSNSVQMGQLIDDLLEFSRMNRVKINFIKINMYDLVREVYEEVVQFEKNREIEFKLADLAGAVGDYGLIKQVWRNLISNAVKYTRKEKISKIKIYSRPENNSMIYYIKDNGVGFDMKYTNKLFGVFQRMHKASEFEGTGVGLALVKRIILKHGGIVKAKSKINEGAVFYFTLPVKED